MLEGSLTDKALGLNAMTLAPMAHILVPHLGESTTHWQAPISEEPQDKGNAYGTLAAP